MKPTINFTVCGKFHFSNYIKYVYQNELLNHFYYSHRIATNAKSMGIPSSKCSNIFLKEYLIYINMRIFKASNHVNEKTFPIYHDIWQALVLARYSKSNILHFMLHGTSNKIIDKAINQKSIILGEPVNCHPLYSKTILDDEYTRLGLSQATKSLSTQHQRLINEIDKCNYLLAPSEFVKNSYIKYGFDGSKIYVIPYGVDLIKFNSFESISRNSQVNPKLRVICVAQISPRKGHIYLLEAFKYLDRANFELLFIGYLSKEMKEVLSKYEGQFTHIDHVPNNCLHNYYRESDVFVLPSLEDGFAVVVTEAMACGLPVIITTNTGASELIEHGKEGYIVTIRSPESIAECLEKLLLNPDLRTRMSEAALEKSKSSLSWELYANRLCDLYKSLYF